MSTTFVPAYPSRARTRTSSVQDAVIQQLMQMREMLDAARDVRAVTISVKMKNGTSTVRAVVVQIDTEMALE